MHGVVKTRHLFTHAWLIVRLFGLRAYARCVVCTLRHPGRATFLEGLRDAR